MKKLTTLLIILSLLSCQKLKYGNVIEKWYEPDRTYIMLIPISTGKSMIVMPYVIFDREDYCIKVHGIGVKRRYHYSHFISV